MMDAFIERQIREDIKASKEKLRGIWSMESAAVWERDWKRAAAYSRLRVAEKARLWALQRRLVKDEVV